MTYGSCHRMWLSNVHTWLNPYVSALFAEVDHASARRGGLQHDADVHRAPSCEPSGDVVVRVGPAIAVERPPVADLADLVEVEVADDQLRLVGVADLADELALRDRRSSSGRRSRSSPSGSMPTRLIAPT